MKRLMYMMQHARRICDIEVDGWNHWVHPDYPDKPYMVARNPGATIKFEMETQVGWIKMYSLKSKSFGLGTVKCWVDEDMDQSVKIEGWWDNGYA